MTATAPPTFRVQLETSEGLVELDVHRDWAPLGADRFYNLVRNGFYDGSRFYRIVPNFIAQFGVPADPQVMAVWLRATIPDDPARQNNRRGTLSFGRAGANSRAVQVFINLGDNPELDVEGFTPFAEVVTGMDVVDRFYADYGEGPPRGRGPDQVRVLSEGENYLRRFPRLDRIIRATIVTN
jgi:peptidyl-prolyl cis-trans isomerase A (cyclophilin A)